MIDIETEAQQPMSQYAPYPVLLAGLVNRLQYRPGWTCNLVHIERDDPDVHGMPAGGLTLIIRADVYDTHQPDVKRPVLHYFIVPAATYDERSWRRWLLDRFIDVETHEACEWFVIDGVRPFNPNHGPGRNPYTIFEYATDADKRTTYRGELS